VAKPLVRVGTLCSLQFFDIDGWIAGRMSVQNPILTWNRQRRRSKGGPVDTGSQEKRPLSGSINQGSPLVLESP